MNYLQQVQQMITEAQSTGKVLMVGSSEEPKLLKSFCKNANIKIFISRRVIPGLPQLWANAIKP